MADDALGNDFPLDLEADDDTNDLLSGGLSPDQDNLQSSYFTTNPTAHAVQDSSLIREGRCTTLVSLLTSTHSSLTTSTTITSTAGHHGAGKPMSVLAAEAAAKAKLEGSKRGPGRPRSDGKLPSQRSRPHFPGRPTNRIRNRIKSPSTSSGTLPPPPSLQLGPKIRPLVSETSLMSPCISGNVSRSCSVEVGEPRSCHECKLVIEETKFLSCDSCEKGYHLQCFKPPVSALPKNPSGIGSGWKCKECRICTDCGSQTPGAGASCRWHLNYSVCDSCYQLRNRGSCCPVCRKAYRVAVNTDMIQCTSCRKMVHPDCDPSRLSGLSPGSKNKKDASVSSYMCPVCEPVKETITTATVTSGVTSGLSSRNSSTASLDELTDSNENLLTRDSSSSFNDESLSSIDFAEGIDTASKVEADDSLLQPQDGQVFQHPRPAHVGGKFPGKKRFSSGSRPRNSGGKFTGKKRPKTADVYRRKRVPKPSVAGAKFKPLPGNAVTGGTSTATNGQTGDSVDKIKDDEPQVETKMVLCSAKDEFVLSQDVCVMCGSLGKGEEGRLIGCSQCGQCYHPYCVNIKVTKVVLTKGWRCLDCTVCEGCGLPHDEAKLLLCDECDISYHTYCLDPPLEEIPQGTWKCNWCVVCVKCSATSPGTGSLWQKNYTECGPCSSESTCPVCSVDYQESDLIIQCSECKRWLHSHCDGMDTEQDCELAADFGYHCLMCRPKDEPAPHVIIRKAMQAKVDELALQDKPSSSRRPSADLGPNGVSNDSKQDISSNSLQARFGNKPCQVHTLDGVVLSDVGHSFIKSLFIEPLKKKMRSRKKVGQTAILESEEPGKEDELEDQREDSSADKKRARRTVKIGVGGFSIKNRSRTSKEDSENNPGEAEDIDNSAAAKRRRRRAKKKQQLSDSFPVYMQEAFFGMSLALPDVKPSTENGDYSCKQLPSSSDLLLSGDEDDDEDVFNRKVSSDKVIHLPSRLRAGSQTTIESKKGEDSSDLLEDDDDLQYEGVFKDLLPQGEDNLMDMLITECEGLDREAGSLTDALQGVKEEDGAKDSADDAIVSELFDIDMVAEGLPHMDSQDVDDIFSGVLSPTGATTGQEFGQPLNQINLPGVQLKQQMSSEPHLGPQIMTQGFPHGSQEVAHHAFPQSMPGQVMASPGFHHIPPQISHHLPGDALPSISPSIAVRMAAPPPNYPQVTAQPQDWNQNSHDTDSEQTQGQKNLVKWEVDEALGDMATISPVIYANLAHPNLRRDFPVWTERVKQIAKLWRQLPSNERQPFLLKARENRAASRQTKSQAEARTSAPNTPPAAQTAPIKTEARPESDQERQWKQLQANRAAHNQEGRPDFGEAAPGFDPNVSGDHALRPSMAMYPPGVRQVNRPQMYTESGQPMRPPFDPLKIQAPFDPYAQGAPRPTRPLSHQRFSPGASSSPSGPLTPGDRTFQSTPPHRPSSRDSFGGENSGKQPPLSPYSQPKTPVASSPFHPSSPSVDHFAQTPTRPQSQPHAAPFSPMTSHSVSSPARHQAGTPGSAPADFETSSPFPRPPSGSGTPNEGFPSPQTSHATNSPLTPSEGNVCQHPLKAATGQNYDPNDPYARPVMTPRPNTSTEGGFSRPIRPPGQYPYQFQARGPERFPRPPVPSDPYSHQPGTPMPSSHDPYSNPPRTPMPFSRQEGELETPGPRQQLRDLLQGQRKDPMRPEGPWMDANRPRLPSPNQGYPGRPPSDGFRPPLPPSMRPPRLSHMPSNQFRHPAEPQRMRAPFDPRMRQMLPPPSPQHQIRHQQWQQQQPGMRMSSGDFQFQRHPGPPTQGHVHQGMPQLHMQRPPFGHQIRHPEAGQHVHSNDTLTDNDPGLPDDIEDDELLGLGADFNLLEYADPELDEALGAVGANKNIFDEHFTPKDPSKASDPHSGQSLEHTSAPPPYPKQDDQHQPPPYSDPFVAQQQDNKAGEQFNPNQGSALMTDLDFENINADLLGDEPIPSQQNHPQFQPQMQGNMPPNQVMFDGQQQWMNQPPHQHHVGMNPDQRFIQQQGHQRFPVQGPPRMPPMVQMNQRPQMPMTSPPGHPALIQAMSSRPRQSLPRYQMPPLHPEPPFPVDEPQSQQDHEVMANYQKWLFEQKALLENEQHKIESEVARLRKIKKTINAKARQLKKNNQEISPQEAAELQQSINDLAVVTKGTDAVKKALRQHQITWENFDSKFKPRGPTHPNMIPQMHSPGSSMGSLPRSVSSPMISTAGPGTPGHSHGPTTPQSPAHMSPSHIPPSPGNIMHSPHHAGHLSPGHAHAPNSPMIQSPVYQQRSPMMPPQGDFEQQGPPGQMRGQPFQQPNHGHRMPGHQMGGHFQGMPPRQPSPHLNQPMIGQQGQRYPHPPSQQMHGHQVFEPQQQPFRSRHPNPSEFSGDHVQNPSFHSPEQGYPRQASHQMQFRPQFVNQQPPVSQHLPISQAGHSMHGMHHQGPPVSQHQMYPQHQEQQHFQHHQMQPDCQEASFTQSVADSQAIEAPINEGVGESKTSMTLNFEEKGLGSESQAGNESLFQNEKNNDPTPEVAENRSQVVVTLVKTEAHDLNHLNETANSSFSGESIDFDESVLNNNPDLTITVIPPVLPPVIPSVVPPAVPVTENLDETDEAKQSEIARQNVLLKQLLQNCPSADASGASKATEASEPDDLPVETTTVKEEAMTSVNETEVPVVPTLPVETTEALRGILTEEVKSEEEASTSEVIASDLISEPSLETPLEGLSEEVVDSLPNKRPPPVERKMSYLDIRRALLEREPTPPPEEAKPKRKRNPAKRKESKAAKEAAAAASLPTTPLVELTGHPIISAATPGIATLTGTPTPPAKKRSRKGSQIKANTDDDYDAFVARVMTQLKKLPPMAVVEPKIKANLNSIIPHGVGDLNSLSPIIRGCFAEGYIPVDDDRVSSTSGQVQPISTARAPLKGFYNQEFPGSVRVLNTVDYTCILREASSPDPFIAPSPESALFKEPEAKYMRLDLTTDDDEVQELEDPSSPEIPITSLASEDIDWDKLVSPPSSTDSDPDRDKENLLSRSKVSGMYTPPLIGGPLKDTGNVAVTLTLSADGPDIKRVLGALAKLLDIEPPTEYQIVEHSEFGEETKNEIRSIDIKSEFPFCQTCDQRILDGVKKTLPSMGSPFDLTESDEKIFCSSPCLQRFSSSDNEVMDTMDDETLDVKPVVDEEPIAEPMEVQEEVTEDVPPEPVSSWADDILAKLSFPIDPKLGVIDSRKWMAVRYHCWTPNLFEARNPVEEENSEEVSRLLESMDIVVKKENLPNDGRKCAFCHEVGDGESDGPARLLNHDVDKWVHLNCALWSPEVYETQNGALMSVDVTLTKAMTVTCVKCHKTGASIRCFKARCTNVYHFACALVDNRCMFLKDKSFFCATHAQKAMVSPDSIMTSFVVNRRVYINRDDYKQLEQLIQDQGVMRIGSLVLLNIGQLLPTQLMNFHSSNCIYPVGYKAARFYWSRTELGKRNKYICSINEVDGSPEFVVEEQERGIAKKEAVVIARGKSPRLVWREIVESVAQMNKQDDHIKVFADQITGEDLFGLTEQSVSRILESMQGVDTLQDYNFRYIRSQLLELPLAINPSGCARTEPKLRTHFKRPHTMHTSNPSRSSLQSSFSSVQEVQSPYVKQFVHSKSSQYRKMKTEWRNNVYLARSRIAGLGLFAARDIEKHTMVIEYIGLLIRNELAERNERMYEQQVCFIRLWSLAT